jgi:hypothetical protein
MTFAVTVASNEISGWRETLLILTFERWQPLLADLGVPAEIAEAPVAVQAAAERCWQIRLALHAVPSQSREDYRAMTEAMVSDFLTQVGVDYGETPARGLHQWVARQYTDDFQRNSYLVWSQLLRRLAGIAGLGYPLVSLTLPATTIDSLTSTVKQYLSLELQRNDAARIAATASSPVSAIEHLLRSREPDLVSSTEESLGEAVTNQRAFRALSQIVQTLHASECDTLTTWAREQAATMQMPIELVALPHA